MKTIKMNVKISYITFAKKTHVKEVYDLLFEDVFVDKYLFVSA